MKEPAFVREVNGRLPEVQGIMEKVFELSAVSVSLTKDIHNLFHIWGKQLHDADNPDHNYYKERMVRKNAINIAIRNEMGRIEQLGGVVKDLRMGLVDFLLEVEGEPVFLCWKYGEKDIRFWHPTNSGYSARRPLEELEKANAV